MFAPILQQLFALYKCTLAHQGRVNFRSWAEVMVKWSACLPFSPTNRVRVCLKSINIFSVKLFLKITKIKPNRCRGWHIFIKKLSQLGYLRKSNSCTESGLCHNCSWDWIYLLQLKNSSIPESFHSKLRREAKVGKSFYR